MFANVRTRTACNKTLAFYDFATATIIMLLLEAIVSKQKEVVHSQFSGYAVTKILLHFGLCCQSLKYYYNTLFTLKPSLAVDLCFLS